EEVNGVILKRFLYLFITLAFLANISLAQEFPKLIPKDELKGFEKRAVPVIVNGDRVEYFQDKKKIIGSGNVNITYGDVKLTCDKITVFTDTKIGICEGNVKITQPNGSFKGEKIRYDFVNKTGSIIDGYVRAGPIYAHAEKVEKVSKDKIVFDDGYVTTCDLEKPHYRIQAKQVRLYLDDKVVAKHVFFFIGNVPLFYVPYYVQPIRDVKTKITVIPGYKDDWGYYALGAYRYYLDEKCKGYLRLDYREKKGLGEGIDYKYNLDELGDGIARFYFAQENNDLAIKKTGSVDDRWRLQYKHLINFRNDTMGVIEINKLSDENMIKDYFYKEYEEGMEADNYISCITTKPNYNFKILARKRLDDFFTVTERLPEVSLQVNNQRLWDTFFYYYNEMSFTNFSKKYKESLDSEDEEALRFDTYHKLSYAARLFRSIYATPYAATRQTYYSRNKWGEDNLLREIYEYGLDLSTKFYRTFDIEIPAIDIYRLRHIITPTVGFYHRRQPSISPDNLFQFDTIDGLDYQNGISLSLEHKLQTKRGKPDGWKSVDLLRFIVSTDYLYRFKKSNLGFKGVGKFTDVKYELELRPYDWLFAQTDITMRSKDRIIKSANTDLICDLGEKLKFGMGHRYEHSNTDTTSQFTLDATYKINEGWSLSKGWAIRAYERFDTHDQKWQEQEYTIYKDLHCWLGELTCNIKEGEYSFWVIFRIKAFPDVPIGLKRTYHRPTPGSMR
ncbi:MAG: LPS-assembly protein LptD, partial [Candidatus Omnitrophica bacterium]|nr:LPS-assembly protein LptD [Candidatus Omnitrophota bacterium]